MAKDRMKFLVVDDDSFVRDMLAAILESCDYDVVTAQNGSDAFDKTVADSEIDLVISDMNMPVMNGLELIKALRIAKPDIPIIILTANNEISVAIEAMKIGANDYLLKDENIQETVLISVKNVMERHELRMQNIQLMEDLAQKNRELERMAFVDGLTGIPNRRYFDNTSLQEWKRAAREGTPISIVISDIDFFKLYNDTYGHQQGDDCLKKVAEALSETLERSGDFVSRYGGEEFVAILPNTDQEGAAVVARNMRSNVIALNIPHESSKAADQVTVSIGIGSVIPVINSDPSELISLVDKALYEAKQEGRNRIKTVDAADVKALYNKQSPPFKPAGGSTKDA